MASHNRKDITVMAKETKTNVKSRFDEGRKCCRVSEHEYVYFKEVAMTGGKSYYQHLSLKEGEEGITTKWLDILQALDNAEAQNEENQKRVINALIEHKSIYPEDIISDSPQTEIVREKVIPHLSEAKQKLLYDRYGRLMTEQEIADDDPPKSSGKRVTQQAVSKRLKCLHEEVEKYLLWD